MSGAGGKLIVACVARGLLRFNVCQHSSNKNPQIVMKANFKKNMEVLSNDNPVLRT